MADVFQQEFQSISTPLSTPQKLDQSLDGLIDEVMQTYCIKESELKQVEIDYLY